MASLNSLCYICNQTTSSDSTVRRISPDIECHSGCLKCYKCGVELEEDTTCYIEEDRVYCKADYTQLFCKRCARCGQLFEYEEEALRVKSMHYHERCFKCDSCQAAIDPKSPFVLSHTALYCNEDHYYNICDIPDIKEETFSPHTSTSSSSSSLSHTPTSKSHKNSSSTRTQQEKQTRVRTVLNEQQLSVLRQYYSANARPDAVMKDQLVELTGLSSRVIRVWFQNKRCKDKKKVLMDQRKGSQTVSLPQPSLQDEERNTTINDKASSPENQPFSADAYLGFPCGQDDQPFSPWSDPVETFTTQPANLTSAD